ncbi:hypothetical protein GCM10023322_63640 [Rugosimonospora acidiphila]|uniref:Uncharacterized protein n=1 Tax=Rugosimonospora acidiphila TaxID=556531 RepID=A0ABP9SJR5_9ACTN
MDVARDGERVAASLTDWLAALTFAERGPDEVTALVVNSIVEWATGQGWRVYRRAPSVLPLPPPYQHRHSYLDVACARPGGAPIAIEVDHTDRRRTVDKLLAEAAEGRIAIWVRWGSRGFAPPPPPVLMVTCPVTSVPGRAYSRLPATSRPAPDHTAVDLGFAEQPDLFA